MEWLIIPLVLFIALCAYASRVQRRRRNNVGPSASEGHKTVASGGDGGIGI